MGEERAPASLTISIEEISARTGWKPSLVRRRIHDGVIPSHQAAKGKRIVVLRREFERCWNGELAATPSAELDPRALADLEITGELSVGGITLPVRFRVTDVARFIGPRRVRLA